MVYKTQGITEVLLHATTMATAIGAEGLALGSFFFPQRSHFLQSGILEGFVSGLLFQAGFLQSCSTFYKASLTPATGTFPGVRVGGSSKQGQPCGCVGLCHRDPRCSLPASPRLSLASLTSKTEQRHLSSPLLSLPERLKERVPFSGSLFTSLPPSLPSTEDGCQEIFLLFS